MKIRAAVLHEVGTPFSVQEVDLATPQTGEAASTPAAPAADTASNSVPSQWPLAVAGTIVARDDTTSSTRGMDIEAPAGTEVRASGAGSVVEVSVDSSGTSVVRIAHRDGYETTYADAQGQILATRRGVLKQILEPGDTRTWTDHADDFVPEGTVTATFAITGAQRTIPVPRRRAG